jgi:predicted secreted protein
MAAGSGRRVRIAIDGADIAGAKTDSMTVNNEPIDVTDKDSVGWRTLLADVGSRSVDANVEGILIGDTLLALGVGAGSALLPAATITVESIGVFAGNFYLNSVELGGAMDGENTFSATLQSSGVITFTAA